MVKKKPDLIFINSWEVCNKVGGIYTVLSTQVASLQSLYGENLIYVGPDLKGRSEQPEFREVKSIFPDWKKNLEQRGLKVRIGRWKIPGNPVAILVDFSSGYNEKNQIYSDIWKWYGVDSLNAWGDYDESCMFSVCCAKVICNVVKSNLTEGQKVIAHFHEWTTGMGLLYCKQNAPGISTVFTTHATSIGRSICGNDRPLYEFMSGYNPDQMARELNMVSKHSLEKTAAKEASCFTTVSEITARECRYLLGKQPDIVTPNGFEDKFIKKGSAAGKLSKESRRQLSDVAKAVFGHEIENDTVFVGIGGRYEFRNKGIDVFIDALQQLKNQKALNKEVIGIMMIPADVSAPRVEVTERLAKTDKADSGPIYMPYLTHWLNNIEHDKVINMLKHRGFTNMKDEKVKILFVPCYLDGRDGIFNKTYYDLLYGMDLTVFPSYYEPWGYTPLESVSFSVPTITTNLAGFGDWAKRQKCINGISDGIAVVNRTDHNYKDVVNEICLTMLDYINKSDSDKKDISQKAHELSEKALWPVFINEYEKAYSIALSSN